MGKFYHGAKHDKFYYLQVVSRVSSSGEKKADLWSWCIHMNSERLKMSMLNGTKIVTEKNTQNP